MSLMNYGYKKEEIQIRKMTMAKSEEDKNISKGGRKRKSYWTIYYIS